MVLDVAIDVGIDGRVDARETSEWEVCTHQWRSRATEPQGVKNDRHSEEQERIDVDEPGMRKYISIAGQTQTHERSKRSECSRLGWFSSTLQYAES